MSFAPPSNDDGAVTVTTGSYYGTYIDMDGMVRNEIELVTRYRDMAMQPELETAIDEIVNEAVVIDDNSESVKINVDDVKVNQSVKNKITAEFEQILKLLNFGNMGQQIFRRWYIDGRMFYHVILDEEQPQNGIVELRYIDPRRIRKVREIQKGMDVRTGLEIVKNVNEYYLYNERGVIGVHNNMGIKISADSIVNINSDLMDSKRVMVLSYLHKAIKPLNQLRMVEDAAVIYRLSRAPERRVFYIDVGNMPRIKAEQYLKDIVTKYRNKMVYDASTGEVRDDRKYMSMMEDIWLPRREGSKGTEISTLPGGQNLGEMEDVNYFERKLYKSLGVPIGRLEPQNGFSLGRSTEITRDELKFTKFVQRLRARFANLFDDLLRIQLVSKKICSVEEWNEIKENIWYDFLKDNNFNELKEVELLTNRMTLLTQMDPYVGKYFSKNYIMKHVLRLDDEEIEEMRDEMEEEQAELTPPVGPDGQPIDASGMPLNPPQQMDPNQAQLMGYGQPTQGTAQDPNAQPLPSRFVATQEDMELK